MAQSSAKHNVLSFSLCTSVQWPLTARGRDGLTMRGGLVLCWYIAILRQWKDIAQLSEKHTGMRSAVTYFIAILGAH